MLVKDKTACTARWVRGDARRISASAHQLIGAQVWLGAHVTDGVLALQASVVEHSDQSRKTVTEMLAATAVSLGPIDFYCPLLHCIIFD